MKKNGLKIIVSLIVLIAVVLIYKNYSSTQSSNAISASDILSQLQDSDKQAALDSTRNSPAAMIEFKKNLFIDSKSYSIDGGPLVKIPCTPQGVEFGRLQLTQNMIGSLNCIEEYMGGIYLEYDTDDMQNGKIPLAQTDGDAGDHWDSAAFLFKDGKGNVKMEFITHMTSVEFDDKNPALCEIMQNALAWDESKKVFSLTKFEGQFREKLFPAPEAKDCKNNKWIYK